MLSDQEILRVISAEVVDARGYDSDELSADRITALNYYNGRPNGL